MHSRRTSFRAPLARASRRVAAAGLTVLLALAASCGGDSATRGATPGKMTLLLTDAPGDFQKAVVTISSIYLQSGDGANGRVVLRDTPVTTDLLTLANSTSELVKDAVVPAGSYSQLRFVITGGYVEVDNGDGTTSIYASSPDYEGLPAGAQVAGSLQMPSYAQSGLKVNLPGGSTDVNGDQKIVLVDFDVARSFGKEAGNSGKWVMSPVLTATEFSTTSTLHVALSKADTVTLPQINNAAVTLGDFKAVLSNTSGSKEEITLTDVDNDGVFEGDFNYVVPGDWSLDFTPPSDSISFTTNPAHPIALTIGSGGTSSQAAEVTSAVK
jgi:hypothetical protein